MANNHLTHFRKGLKQIYLPNFTLTFIRSPSLPPTFAKFIVPLSFNKLDIRDYLFHAYNVRVLSVRSFIQQQPVQANQKGQKFRARAIKKMTVEMDKPFVWPEEPEDFEAWGKQTRDAAEEYSQEGSRKQSLTEFQRRLEAPPKEHRQTLAEQAKALLQGQEKWRPTWQTLGKRQDVVEGKTRGRGS